MSRHLHRHEHARRAALHQQGGSAVGGADFIGQCFDAGQRLTIERQNQVAGLESGAGRGGIGLFHQQATFQPQDAQFLRQQGAHHNPQRRRMFGAGRQRPRFKAPHFHTQLQRRTLAPDCQFRLFPGSNIGNQNQCIRRLHHFLAAHFQDHVTGTQTGAVSGAADRHITDQRPGRTWQAERIGQCLRDFLHRHADAAARHGTLVLQLGLDAHRDINRDRKGQALIAAVAAVDAGIDADHFALQIEQRATGIARIDRHIGLQEGNVIGARQHPALGADDADRDRVAETIGRTDGQRPTADLSLCRIADAHGRQAAGVDFEQGDIGHRIETDQPGPEFAAVGQLDADLATTFDHMGIGQDVAVAADDKTGTETAVIGIVLRRRAIQAPLPLIQSGIGCHRLACHANVDHRRAIGFDQWRKIGRHFGRRDLRPRRRRQNQWHQCHQQQ